LDSISDKEIGEIWKRTKRKISTSKIKGKTRQEVIDNLKSELNNIPDENKSGSPETLIKKGFAERIADQSFFQKEFVSVVKIEEVKPVIKPKIVPKRFIAASFVRKPTAKRVSIRSKGRFRSFKRNNIKFTEFTFKGKSALNVYNIRTKKRLTWGLI